MIETRENQVLVVQARKEARQKTKAQLYVEGIAQERGITLKSVNPLNNRGAHIWKNPDLLRGYGGYIYWGSSDIHFSQPSKGLDLYVERAVPLAKRNLDENENAFGICFGHQTLAVAGGGKVASSSREVGTKILHLTPEGQEDIIFRGYPRSAKMLFAHNDSVVEVPPDFIRLGYTDVDPNSVLRMGNAISTQGHPDIPGAKNLLDTLGDSIHSSYKPTDRFEDPNPTEILLVNFFEQVTNKTNKQSARQPIDAFQRQTVYAM